MNKLGMISVATLLVSSACASQNAQPGIALDVETPQTWSMETAQAGEGQDGWLGSIDDPLLTSLVFEALDSNPDLAQAQGRLNRARALQGRSRSAQYPSLSLTSSSQTRENLDGGDDTTAYSTSLSASWEVDLWNRLQNEADASTLDAQSSEADFHAIRLLIAANTAQAYFLLIEANRLAEVERSNLESLDETLGFVSIQFERGLRSSEDIALIKADVETARASLEQALQAKRDASRAIEVLVGRYPDAELAGGESSPKQPEQLTVGTPASLLERRADIRAAKFQILSAHARTKSARAELLPRLSTQASFGGSNSSIEDLFDPSALAASFIANGAQVLFDGRARRSNIDAADADLEIALAAYQSLVLDAYNEVETELDRGAVLERRERHLQLALQEAEDALRFSRFRYELGESDLLNVLSIQQRVASLQAALARIQRARLDQYVTLALALGSDI